MALQQQRDADIRQVVNTMLALDIGLAELCKAYEAACAVVAAGAPGDATQSAEGAAPPARRRGKLDEVSAQRGSAASAAAVEVGRSEAVKPKAGVKDGGSLLRKVVYRDPQSGRTWTGIGLRPLWVRKALEAGRSLDDFRVS